MRKTKINLTVIIAAAATVVSFFCFAGAALAAVPSAITDLKIFAGNQSVILEWSLPAGNPTGYLVEFGTTESGIFDQVCSTGDCIDNMPGAIVNNLAADTEYSFRVFAFNDDGMGGVSNTVTVTPFGPCTGAGENQFCGQQLLLPSSVLAFSNIPDSFNFPGISVSSAAQDIYNNSDYATQPALPDVLGVEDTRISGGFEVQLQTNGDFTDGVNDIPLSGLHVATSATSPVYTISGTDTAVSCPGTDCGVVYGTSVTTRGINAPLDSQGGSLGNTSTFSADLGSTAVVLMNAGLPATSGRNGFMYQFVNFLLNVPAFQQEGNYALILTYTLLDNTT